MVRSFCGFVQTIKKQNEIKIEWAHTLKFTGYPCEIEIFIQPIKSHLFSGIITEPRFEAIGQASNFRANAFHRCQETSVGGVRGFVESWRRHSHAINHMGFIFSIYLRGS